MQPEIDSRQDKRKKRSERRRKQSRAEILEVARAVLLADGIVGFSLAKVVDELGLTKPALYYYFASKEALMFELLLQEWIDSAEEIEAAVAATEGAAESIEVMMRTAFERYRNHLDLFRLVYSAQTSNSLAKLVGPDELERIRPINDKLYAGAEEHLRRDERASTFPESRDPRRFAFTAHMAVIGLLNMKAIVESADDPLVHDDDDLIDDICRTFRDAVTREAP